MVLDNHEELNKMEMDTALMCDSYQVINQG